MKTASPPTPRDGRALAPARLRRLTELLDTAIRLPGGFRIGWDAIIGLVPGVGDVTGAALSLYVVFHAARLGASRATLLRMLGNVGLEALVGAVPLLGDLFDAAFKANTRNLALLEAHLAQPERVRRTSRLWLWGVLVGLLAFLTGVLVLSARVVKGVMERL